MSPIIFASAQDIGRRKIQEDSLGTWTDGQNRTTLVVADGLGGLPNGELASRAAVDTVIQHAETVFPCTEKALDNLIQEVNQLVLKSGGATTLCVTSINQENCWIVNVGDSRAYLFRNQRLYRITLDHRLFPHSNILTRCLGTGQSVKTDLFRKKLKEKDLILLCTDGLTDLLSDEEITKILKGHQNPQELAKQLLNKALSCDASDNITLILAANS